MKIEKLQFDFNIKHEVYKYLERDFGVAIVTLAKVSDGTILALKTALISHPSDDLLWISDITRSVTFVSEDKLSTYEKVGDVFDETNAVLVEPDRGNEWIYYGILDPNLTYKQREYIIEYFSSNHRTFTVDLLMAVPVIIFNMRGFYTTFSCQGHSRPDLITDQMYLTFDYSILRYETRKFKDFFDDNIITESNEGPNHTFTIRSFPLIFPEPGVETPMDSDVNEMYKSLYMAAFKINNADYNTDGENNTHSYVVDFRLYTGKRTRRETLSIPVIALGCTIEEAIYNAYSIINREFVNGIMIDASDVSSVYIHSLNHFANIISNASRDDSISECEAISPSPIQYLISSFGKRIMHYVAILRTIKAYVEENSIEYSRIKELFCKTIDRITFSDEYIDEFIGSEDPVEFKRLNANLIEYANEKYELLDDNLGDPDSFISPMFVLSQDAYTKKFAQYDVAYDEFLDKYEDKIIETIDSYIKYEDVKYVHAMAYAYMYKKKKANDEDYSTIGLYFEEFKRKYVGTGLKSFITFREFELGKEMFLNNIKNISKFDWLFEESLDDPDTKDFSILRNIFDYFCEYNPKDSEE